MANVLDVLVCFLKLDNFATAYLKTINETVLERSCNNLKDCSEGFILKLDQ